MSSIIDTELSSGDEEIEEQTWQDAMMEYDPWETVPKLTVALVIEHAVVDEIFLKHGKYTLKILEDQGEKGVTSFGGEHFPCKGVLALPHCSKGESLSVMAHSANPYSRDGQQ